LDLLDKAKALAAQTAKRLQPLVVKLQAMLARRFPKVFGG